MNYKATVFIGFICSPPSNVSYSMRAYCSRQRQILSILTGNRPACHLGGSLRTKALAKSESSPNGPGAVTK